MSAESLVSEIESLARQLREKALKLAEEIKEPAVSDRRGQRMLLNIFVDSVKVTRAVDRLTKECRKYLEHLEAERNEPFQ